MALALGGACADGAPGDQVGNELRAQQVQEFGAGRQAQGGQLEQQAPGALQAFVDGEAAIQVRIVDVALPADGGARLLEVGAHHDEQVVLQGIGNLLQALRVFDGLVVVMDGARADHDHQPVVAAVQHVGDRRAAAFHQCQCVVANGHAFLQERGRDERTDGADAHVVDAGGVEGAVAGADFGVVEGVVEAGHGRGCDSGLMASPIVLPAPPSPGRLTSPRR